MFACMWERGLKMDDPAVFRQALADAGLPTDRLLELIGVEVNVTAPLGASPADLTRLGLSTAQIADLVQWRNAATAASSKPPGSLRKSSTKPLSCGSWL
jgi:hypothetical protein